MSKLKTKQSGRSMIEMLGVLAIIGVLSVGGIAGYNRAIARNKVNETITQATSIITNIRTLYTQQMDYAELTTESAKKLGIIPDEMIIRAHSSSGEGHAEIVSEHVKHKLLGNVIISGAGSRVEEVNNADVAARTAFILEFDGLSRDACVAISTADWGAASSAGFIGIMVKTVANEGNDNEQLVIGCQGTRTTNDTTIACPQGKVQPIPMHVSEASVACRCETTNSCSVVWKYF